MGSKGKIEKGNKRECRSRLALKEWMTEIEQRYSG